MASVAYLILARKLDLAAEMTLVRAAALNTYDHAEPLAGPLRRAAPVIGS